MAKQKRDAEATRSTIVGTAMLLFSKQGYDATTMDDIAAHSGFNKALIYYYFKNKAGLYATVMSGLFDAIYEEVMEAERCCDSPVAELRAFIFTYADYAGKNPYFPALLLRELSDSGAHLPEMMFASMRRLFLLLSDILKRGEEAGVFAESIPMVVHFMIVGSLSLMVTTAPLRKKAAEVDIKAETCSGCPMDKVAEYLFATVKKSLEVK